MDKNIIRRELLTVLSLLPERCASRLQETGQPIVIVRGERGYYPMGTDFDVDAYNKARGITAAQVEAMVAGSMFGWDTPGADPANYQGKEKI